MLLEFLIINPVFFIVKEKISIRGYMCCHDGTYNHLTSFEKSKRMKSEPQDVVFVFHVFTPKLSCLSRYSWPYVWKQYGLMN